MTAHKQSGFTLIEMLIAMFIFALISAGTMTALTSSLQSKDRLAHKMNELAEFETARALIKSDMESLVLRQNRDSFGAPEPIAFAGGTDALLKFTRQGRDNPGGLEPRGDLQRVTYLFEDGVLIRRTWAHANPAQQTQEFDRVMLTGLVQADVNFRIGNQKSFQIEVSPTGAVQFPDAMELTLSFENGDRLRQLFELSL